MAEKKKARAPKRSASAEDETDGVPMTKKKARVRRDTDRLSGVSLAATRRTVRDRPCVLCGRSPSVFSKRSSTLPASICLACSSRMHETSYARLTSRSIAVHTEHAMHITETVVPTLEDFIRGLRDAKKMGAFPYAFLSSDIRDVLPAVYTDSGHDVVRGGVNILLKRLDGACTRLKACCGNLDASVHGAFVQAVVTLSDAVRDASDAVGGADTSGESAGPVIFDNAYIMHLGTYVALHAAPMALRHFSLLADLLQDAVDPDSVRPLDGYVEAQVDDVMAWLSFTCDELDGAASSAAAAYPGDSFARRLVTTSGPDDAGRVPLRTIGTLDKEYAEAVPSEFFRMARTLRGRIMDVMIPFKTFVSRAEALGGDVAPPPVAKPGEWLRLSITRDAVEKCAWDTMPYRDAGDMADYKARAQSTLQELTTVSMPLIRVMADLLGASNLHAPDPPK